MKIIKNLTLVLILLSSANSLHFQLFQGKEKCFVDELYQNSVVVIKYEIYGADYISDKNIKQLESIQIKIYKERNTDLLSRHILRDLKGKFSITVEETTHYKICFHNIISNFFKGKQIYGKIKIESDVQDEVAIDKALKKEDVSPISEKIESIIKNTKKVIRKQKEELDSEDMEYNLQQKYSHAFFYFTIFQIVIISLLGLYQLFSFRKFLIFNKII